eukprot:scaffold4659_cov352-Prasinococcus_capsulatus_cf.AAC.8
MRGTDGGIAHRSGAQHLAEVIKQRRRVRLQLASPPACDIRQGPRHNSRQVRNRSSGGTSGGGAADLVLFCSRADCGMEDMAQPRSTSGPAVERAAAVARRQQARALASAEPARARPP